MGKCNSMNIHKKTAAFRAHIHETRQTKQQYVKISHTEFHTNWGGGEKHIVKQSMASAIFTKFTACFVELSYTNFIKIGRKIS